MQTYDGGWVTVSTHSNPTNRQPVYVQKRDGCTRTVSPRPGKPDPILIYSPYDPSNTGLRITRQLRERGRMNVNADSVVCPACEGTFDVSSCTTCDGTGHIDNSIVESPSGWSYRASQENGDNVDCRECGNPLDDNFAIVNDANGYAYHEPCLPSVPAP